MANVKEFFLVVLKEVDRVVLQEFSLEALLAVLLLEGTAMDEHKWGGGDGDDKLLHDSNTSG